MERFLMPIPNLIHPTKATIEIIDKAGTTINENAGERVRTAKKKVPTITIPCQVHWGKEDDPKPNKAGTVEESAGWLTMRVKDLNVRSLLDDNGNPGIPRGSKIIKLGRQNNLKLFTTKEKAMGHHPDLGGHGLVRIYFQDRNG